jgi:hypothetical protein
VDTKLGRIYDFAKNFAIMNANDRVFDNHLIKSLSQSSEYSSCWIPFGSGNAERSHSFQYGELKDCMERHIKYSLAHTEIGNRIVTDDEGRIADFTYRGWDGTGTEFFPTPVVIQYNPVTGEVIGGDAYEDLEISFYFGDDNGLDRREFAAPDIVEVERSTGGFMQYLPGFPVIQYSQVYSVMYPVIVGVWDEEARESFNFATFVFMENNAIKRGCGTRPVISQVEQSEYAASYDDICVNEATIPVNLKVEYDDGSPVIGADVRVYGCKMTTAGNGIIHGFAPSRFAYGALEVHDGNSVHTQGILKDELVGKVVQIPRSATFNFHFYEVPVLKSGDSYDFVASSTASNRIEMVMYRMVDILEPRFFESIINMNDDGMTTYAVRVDNIPVDEYVAAFASVTRSDGTVIGSMNMTGFVAPEYGRNLYVYVPVMVGEYSEEEDLQGLRDAYDSCPELDLITTVPWGGSCA